MEILGVLKLYTDNDTCICTMWGTSVRVRTPLSSELLDAR